MDMKFLAIVALATGLAACAGVNQKSQWQGRIGQDSLEDATRALGAPESCVGLDGGGTVCSWTKAKGQDWIEKRVLTFDAQGRLATMDDVRL
jgi:starvation-inducible outer membrane lipoprotein